MSLSVAGTFRELDLPRHRAELYRAWSTANSGGLSHLAAIDGIPPIAAPSVDAVRTALAAGLRQNKSVAVIARTNPALLSPFESAALVAGDESQRIGAALTLLADYFTREAKRHHRVRIALGYPLFFGITASFGATLPVLWSRGRTAYLVAIVAALTAFFMLGGILLDALARADLARRPAALWRFARVCTTLLGLGVPRGRALRLAADGSQNTELQRHVAARSDRDLQALPLATLFAGCRAIPADLMSQLAIADITGGHAETLRRYADDLESREGSR